MNIRTILVGAGVLALGGYALYDYNSPDSKLARELKEIEQLEPDIKPPECFPKGQNAKLFAVAIQRDRRPKTEMADEVRRRSAIVHDCIRGNEAKTIGRVGKALGSAGVPVYAEVLEKCPVTKDDYPVYACFALDALYSEGGKEASAALEKARGVLTGLGVLIFGFLAILLVRAMFRPWERGRKDRDQGNRDFDRTHTD